MKSVFLICLLSLATIFSGCVSAPKPKEGVGVIQNMTIDANQNMWVSGYTTFSEVVPKIAGGNVVYLPEETRLQWLQVCPLSTATGMSPNVGNPILTCHLVQLEDFTSKWNQFQKDTYNTQTKIQSKHSDRLNDIDLNEEENEEEEE